MSQNQYINYYVNQAGSGISGFEGIRYQRGHGIFGKFFTESLLPLLKYLGVKAWDTGVGIANDAFKGQNIVGSAKKRLKRTAMEIADDGYAKVKKFAQSGSGKRRRRTKPKTKPTKKKSVLKLKSAKKVQQRRQRKQPKKKRKVTKSKKVQTFF
jgi:hypothetical protein